MENSVARIVGETETLYDLNLIKQRFTEKFLQGDLSVIEEEPSEDEVDDSFEKLKSPNQLDGNSPNERDDNENGTLHRENSIQDERLASQGSISKLSKRLPDLDNAENLSGNGDFQELGNYADLRRITTKKSLKTLQSIHSERSLKAKPTAPDGIAQHRNSSLNMSSYLQNDDNFEDPIEERQAFANSHYCIINPNTFKWILWEYFSSLLLVRNVSYLNRSMS